jgi:hypothetical protein
MIGTFGPASTGTEPMKLRIQVVRVATDGADSPDRNKLHAKPRNLK